MTQSIVELRDYHFLRVTPGEHNLDFELVERIISNGKDDERVRITGFLKWDGCMNWKTSSNVMYHFCEEDDANLLNETFKKLWELGPKYISHWLY